jgi:hypothetical protein
VISVSPDTICSVTEVIVRDGTWTFDGEVIRIVPGHDRKVHKLREALGELIVPATAVAGIAFESGRKAGRLRMRLRDGADPFLQAVGGKLTEEADPYRLVVDRDSVAPAEYLVDEVRNTLLLDEVPPGPTDHFQMRGPGVPLTATAGDGTVSFDGTTIRIEWTEWAEETKKAAGPQEFALTSVNGVEWVPIVGFTNGFLRFRVAGASALQPKHDPKCITWGMLREGGTTSLLAAAVIASLPHPNAPASESPAELSAASADSDNHDTVLRRLRELGDLHRDGILTDEEFATAKQALLRQM